MSIKYTALPPSSLEVSLMKPRHEAAAFAERLLHKKDGRLRYHEVRQLLDFIWGGEPENEAEFILTPDNGVSKLQEEHDRKVDGLQRVIKRRDYQRKAARGELPEHVELPEE